MLNLLILDDETAVLSSLCRCLRSEFRSDHVTIETFSDPEAALLRAAEKDFDVFISDYKMPGLNGADVMSLLKRIQPDAVRIVLSASVEPADIMDTVNRGEVFRYLPKPWDTSELIDVVKEAFARRLQRGSAAPVLLTRQELETRRLESEEPGITQVSRDEYGRIRLC